MGLSDARRAVMFLNLLERFATVLVGNKSLIIISHLFVPCFSRPSANRLSKIK